MFDARLGNVLTKEAAELEGFLVEEDKMWAKWLDLLLLRSAVYQSWIVSAGNEKKTCLAFDWWINKKLFLTRLVPMPREIPWKVPPTVRAQFRLRDFGVVGVRSDRRNSAARDDSAWGDDWSSDLVNSAICDNSFRYFEKILSESSWEFGFPLHWTEFEL